MEGFSIVNKMEAGYRQSFLSFEVEESKAISNFICGIGEKHDLTKCGLRLADEIVITRDELTKWLDGTGVEHAWYFTGMEWERLIYDYCHSPDGGWLVTLDMIRERLLLRTKTFEEALEFSVRNDPEYFTCNAVKGYRVYWNTHDHNNLRTMRVCERDRPFSMAFMVNDATGYVKVATYLKELERDELYVNEYVSHPTMYFRLFMDIDHEMPPGHLGSLQANIAAILEKYTDGKKVTVNFELNKKSHKLHVKTNIMVTNGYFHGALRGLREEIYHCGFDKFISQEEWNCKVYDMNAKGLRSVGSVKIDTKSNKVDKEAYYLPWEKGYVDVGEYLKGNGYKVPEKWQKIFEGRTGLGNYLWRYSLYNLKGCIELTSEAITKFSQTQREIEKAREEKRAAYSKLDVPNLYDSKTNTVKFYGKDEPVNDGFVMRVLDMLKPERGKGTRWFFVVRLIKSIYEDGGLDSTRVTIKGEDSDEDDDYEIELGDETITSKIVDYTLGDWSERVSPEEYDEERNSGIYDRDWRLAVLYPKWMALSQLILLTYSDNKKPRSRMLDKNHEVYFHEYKGLMKSIHENFDEIFQYMKDTIAIIADGGNSFFITKNLVNGQVVWKYSKTLERVHGLFPVRLDGETKRYNMAKLVDMVAPDITYNRVDFMPFLTDPPSDKEDVFNLFNGYAHDYDPCLEVDEMKCKPVLDHLRDIWCNGSETMYTYLLNYLAHIIQKPTKRMGVAVLLKSEQGAGKNIMLEFLGNCVIGEKYYVTINNIDRMLGKFNSSCEHKLLIVLDECQNYGGAYKSNDMLKSIITQTKVRIERKNAEAVYVNDYSNIFIATNNDWPVRIEISDRRFLTLECSNRKKDDVVYFAHLADTLNMDTGRHVFHYLAKRNISDWHWAPIPDSVLKRELKLNSVSSSIKYFLSVLKGDEFMATETGSVNMRDQPDVSCQVTSNKLFTNFTSWKSAQQDREHITMDMFYKSVSKLLGSAERFRIDGERVRGYTFMGNTILSKMASHLKIPDLSFEMLDDMDI